MIKYVSDFFRNFAAGMVFIFCCYQDNEKYSDYTNINTRCLT